MQTVKLISIAALLLLAAANSAIADAGGTTHSHCIYHAKHDKQDKSGGRPDFLAEFALSDNQQQDMAALLQLYQPRLAEIRKRGEARRQELIATAPDDPSYTLLSDDVAAEAGSSAREVVVLLTELQTNVYNLLNSDQQAQYNGMRDSMLARLDAYAQEREAARQAGEDGNPFGFGDKDGTRERGEPHACIEHIHPDEPATETGPE